MYLLVVKKCISSRWGLRRVDHKSYTRCSHLDCLSMIVLQKVTQNQTKIKEISTMHIAVPKSVPLSSSKKAVYLSWLLCDHPSPYSSPRSPILEWVLRRCYARMIDTWIKVRCRLPIRLSLRQETLVDTHKTTTSTCNNMNIDECVVNVHRLLLKLSVV